LNLPTVLTSFVGYHSSWLRGDVIAGLTVWADGRTSPSIDVSAVDMLVQLRADLRRQGVDLALAQEVGQVRDVLSHASEHREPAIFPTVDDVIRDH